MRAALYARVSTDEQTIENQLAELREVAKAKGWKIVETYCDEGISGAKGRDKRPGLDAMLKDATRGRFDLVAAWGVDRLGRSLLDLVNGLMELQGSGVELYLHQQAIDTTTPAGKAMYQMMGVFAEFELAMIRARVKAGMERAKASGKHVGRPRLASVTNRRVLRLIEAGKSNRAVARQLGISEGTVRNVRRQPSC